MIILSDITDFDSGCTATSEETGYELDNALDYEKPWLKWRSTDTALQTITLNYTGAIDCIAILGANFDEIVLQASAGFGAAPFGAFPIGGGGGSGSGEKTLGYLRALGEYRGFFSFADQPDSFQLTIPVQDMTDDYFEISAIVIGNYTSLTNKPVSPLEKELILPVNEVMLESQIPKKSALGNSYHLIKANRRGLDISGLDELRAIKRAKGKKSIFVVYENLGKVKDVFLVRRTEDFAYKEAGYNDYQDNLILEELAG